MEPALPTLMAVTMGDACGIGPEIIAKLFRTPEAAGCVVIGDVAVMRRAAAQTGGLLAVAEVASRDEALHAPPNCIPVWPVPGLADAVVQAPQGHVDARAGAAAAACIARAVELALAGQVAGIVTAPVNKEALFAAGVPYPGHTEMLQALACPGGTPPAVRMMLANDELCVVLVTIHMSLRDAIAAVSFDNVLQTLRIAHDSAARFGLAAPRIEPRIAPRISPRMAPRIAVAGLNPHAGEGGLFGSEEVTIIAPAVQAARALGIDAHGPFACDTVFMRARHTVLHPGEFDIVVAMTHDHGLIPVKYLGVEDGVNVTLGLPFVRTSPDHGTAFDIAGSGRADPRSLIAALRMARRLAGPMPSNP